MLQRWLPKQTITIHTSKGLLLRVSVDVPTKVLSIVEAVQVPAFAPAIGTGASPGVVDNEKVEVEVLLGLMADGTIHCGWRG